MYTWMCQDFRTGPCGRPVAVLVLVCRAVAKPASIFSLFELQTA
jgi:hypothetical protein